MRKHSLQAKTMSLVLGHPGVCSAIYMDIVSQKLLLVRLLWHDRMSRGEYAAHVGCCERVLSGGGRGGGNLVEKFPE